MVRLKSYQGNERKGKSWGDGGGGGGIIVSKTRNENDVGNINDLVILWVWIQ